VADLTTQPCVIDGKLVSTTDTLEVLDPATGRPFARTARGTAEHIGAAVAAAREASSAWRRTPARERSRVLRRVAAALRRERDDLVALESQDTGKPLSQARADVDVAARYFDYYANTIEAFFGHTLPIDGDIHAYTRPVPFGVTGHIIPWNYPLQIGCRTVAPAIAVGSCAVVKPAEDAPMTVLRLGQLAVEEGLPPGVLNIVPGLGTEAGAALAGHPGIDHLSFTGSVAIGAEVAAAAATNVIPTALELGGKSPNIVFADADLDRAVPIIVKSVIQNAGQTCSAGSRLLVHESVRDRTLAMVDEAFGALSLGPGLSDPDLGPLISAKQLRRVQEMVGRAESVATRRSAAAHLPQDGFFFPPTLLADVDPQAEIAREEVFGPVVAATTFRDLDEALAIANGTDYGLIAAVWTRDLDTAHVMAEEILAGQVYLNTYGAGGGVEFAFGGFKKSGYGREKGFEALAAFCQTKTVVLRVQR
jgi:aldehyde dehydrogenase (NAD+)